MHLLPPALQPLAESYFDVVNETLLCDAGFWRTATCQSAVDAVIRLANQHFGLALNIPVEPAAMSGIDQELAFCLFQMATLSFAYNASDQKGLRKFMGIRKGLFR